MNSLSNNPLMSKRRAGVLCHLTSLPGNLKFGDIGKDAYKFINFLSNCGFSVWQILPLGPTHADLSPYLSLSAHAGNPQLINLEWLCERGWLRVDELYEHNNSDWSHRMQILQLAYTRFIKNVDKDVALKFQLFLNKHHYWLEKFSLFMALRENFESQPWMKWPQPYRDRDPATLKSFCRNNPSAVHIFQFQQFVFFTQWYELKRYANDKGIFIIGDMPIFVAQDSAEVWSNRKYFALDKTGYPKFVAGVPPDFFSKTGQRWGNPHYRWEKLEEENFSWWVDRIRTSCELYDAIRIDHFRGLVSYWEIPAKEETAVNGRWVTAPGRQLLNVLTNTFPNLCLIAEDLGTITPDVLKLRDEFALPGMNVLQFAFDGSDQNPYLPQNHLQNSLVYTATHDNYTTLGWYETLTDEIKQYIRQCINHEEESMPWPIINAALESKSQLAIIPMQDILCLGKGNRMNTPGTCEGNWQWRFEWNQIDANLQIKYENLLEKYNRTKFIKNKAYSSSHTMQPVSN